MTTTKLYKYKVGLNAKDVDTGMPLLALQDGILTSTLYVTGEHEFNSLAEAVTTVLASVREGIDVVYFVLGEASVYDQEHSEDEQDESEGDALVNDTPTVIPSGDGLPLTVTWNRCMSDDEIRHRYLASKHGLGVAANILPVSELPYLYDLEALESSTQQKDGNTNA